MRDGALDEGSAGPRPLVDRGRMACHELLVFWRKSKRRFEVIMATFGSRQDGHIGFAQPGRRLHQRIKNGLQIESRPADDLEHVSGSGLLLERFAQFIEQARILNSDNGLIGEASGQINLLFRKWMDAVSQKRHHTDRHSIPQEGHTQHRSETTKSLCFPHCVIGISLDVGDMNGPALEHGTARDCAPAGRDRMPPHEIFIFTRVPKIRRQAVSVAFLQENHDIIRAAQSHGRFNERVQHRLQIEGRATDDLEHVGGGGLLLQRLGELGIGFHKCPALLPHVLEQPHVLDRNRRLVGECLQQLDLLL